METALIVGVGPGLGRALALCFAGAGMSVAVAARDAARLEPLAGDLADLGVPARAIACDAGLESDVGALFHEVTDNLGGPDLVVFNAGAFVRKGIIETTSEEFEHCWRVGCLGGFHVGQAAALAMAAKRGRGPSSLPAPRRPCAVAPASITWRCPNSASGPWPRAWPGSWAPWECTWPTSSSTARSCRTPMTLPPGSRTVSWTRRPWPPTT